MKLEGRWRSRLAIGLAVSAATLQVLVASSIPLPSLPLVAIALPAGVVAATGVTLKSRRFTDIPIGIAMAMSGLIALLTFIPALSDPWFFIIAFVEVDIFLLWVGAWTLRQRDFDEVETRWHRRQLSDDRWIPEGADRESGMGPRWEERRKGAIEARDPFATPGDMRED